MTTQDETRAGTCAWCGCTSLCSVKDETLTCAACADEPNAQAPVTHEHLRLFTPVRTMRGQMTL